MATRIDTPSDAQRSIAGFALIEAPSRQDAIASWCERPLQAGGAVLYEVREGGCVGGCAAINAQGGAGAASGRYALLLRSTPALEDEAAVPQARLDALDRHNAAQVAAGVLLAGSGLRTSARGARIKVATNTLSVIDGPFTELKELIAGYWLIRAASMDEAIAWAERNPYPTGPRVTVEIRVLHEPGRAG